MGFVAHIKNNAYICVGQVRGLSVYKQVMYMASLVNYKDLQTFARPGEVYSFT